MSERIAYPDNPIMAGAWYAAVKWASQEPDCIKRFEEATGHKFSFSDSRSPIERAVDKATGYDQESISQFVDWFNANIWGEDPFQGGSNV